MSTLTPTVDIPTNLFERRTWVLYQLHLRHKSWSSLARDTGVTRQAILKAMFWPSSHVEPVIADAIGVTVQQLFPERFDTNGERHPRTREPSRPRRLRNVQRRRVA